MYYGLTGLTPFSTFRQDTKLCFGILSFSVSLFFNLKIQKIKALSF